MNLPAWILLFVLSLLSTGAAALSSAPYMPLADGNSWTYLKDGVLETQTVQPGSYWVNGVATKLVRHSNGDETYATSDSAGIREHKDFVASIYIQGYGYTSGSQTLNPPIKHADAETSIGATVYQSGVDTFVYTGIGSFPLSYSWSSTIVGYETVSVPAGTFNALKISEVLVVSGYVGSTYVQVNGTNTVWAVANLGSVKSVNITNGVTETRVLSSSNLLRPIASLNPTSLNFGTQTQNTTGSSQTVVLSNTGAQTLNLWGLYAQPSNQFPMSHDCGGSLAPGASCNIQVSFSPISPGSSQGSLTISDNASDSPQSVSLYGVGLAPTYTYTASASPTSLSFGNQATGTASVSQPVTLSNTGTGSLNILSISVTGAYTQSNNCVATPLAAGTHCTINVAFNPASIGSQGGTLTLSSDAGNSPQTVSLSGTGVVPPAGAVIANLVAGWNLNGNATTGTVDVAATFGDAARVTSVWKWVPGLYPGWAFYSPSLAGGGAAYAASKGYSFLTTINGGEGFWVDAKQGFSMYLGSGGLFATGAFKDGSGTAGANALPQSWSLIAVGDNPTPRAFANGIARTPPGPGTPAATTLISLWAWHPGNGTQQAGWYFYAPEMDNSGGLAGYIAGKGYLDFGAQGKTLDATTGFWVNHP